MAKPMTALIIMDGFGIDPDTRDNAIVAAGTPHLDALTAKYPHTQIGASGLDVGLPDGQMGNSEVGHTTSRTASSSRTRPFWARSKTARRTIPRCT